MPTNVDRRVTLGIFGNISDLKAKLGWVSAEKAKLEKDGVKVPVTADTKPATVNLDDLRKKLEVLSVKRTSLQIKTDDKEARAALDSIDYKLVMLDKKVSKPKVSVSGTAKALADISAIDLALDRLNKKSGPPSGGGGRSIGNLFGLFGGGASAAGSSGGGGGGLSFLGPLSNPYVAGGAAGAAALVAPFAGQALGGTLIAGLGSALAGLGIAGSFGIGGSTPQQVQAAQQALAVAQARQRAVAAANAK